MGEMDCNNEKCFASYFSDVEHGCSLHDVWSLCAFGYVCVDIEGEASCQ